MVEERGEGPELPAVVASLLSTGRDEAREGARQAFALLAGGEVGHAAVNLVTTAWHAGDVLGGEGVAPDSTATWIALLSLLNSADGAVLFRYPPSAPRSGSDWVPYWRGLAALVHSGAAIDAASSTWRGSALSFIYLAGDHERPLAVARLAHDRDTINTAELERLLALQDAVGPAVSSGIL